MHLADCTPGREVIIGVKYLLNPLTRPLGGVRCTVLDTRPAPARPGDNRAYPQGMVQVRLPEGVQWGCREPWFGPEDLGFLGVAVPVHLVIHLPDGRQAWIDSREPIALFGATGRTRGPAQRIMAALADHREPDPDDMAAVAAWLDAHGEQSELCRSANPVLNGRNCGHFPGGELDTPYPERP
jgi:hypothetical protein